MGTLKNTALNFNFFAQYKFIFIRIIKMLKLFSATPSPFARKVRVVLLEKNVPFKLVTVNSWNLNANIERFNPLGRYLF
jgi:hypothetical protein